MKDIILVGAAVAAVVLLTRGKVGGYTGEGVGRAAVGFGTGIVKGATGEIIDYAGYMDEWGKRTNPFHLKNIRHTLGYDWIKRLGNDDRWFW